MDGLIPRLRERLGFPRDRWAPLSLAQSFHVAFAALLVLQAVAALGFFGSFQNFVTSSRLGLESSVKNVVTNIQLDKDIRVLLAHPEAATRQRALDLTPIAARPPLNTPQKQAWDELKACRRTFQGEGLEPLGACAAVLPPASNPAWKHGDFIFVTLHFNRRLVPMSAQEDNDKAPRDHIRLWVLQGDTEVASLMVTPQKVGEEVYPRVRRFNYRDREPAKAIGFDTQCVLQLPEDSQTESTYICQLNVPALLGRAKIKRPPSMLGQQFRVRAQVWIADEPGERPRLVATTFDARGDILGAPIQSLDSLLGRWVGSGLRMEVRSPDDGVIWSGARGDAQGRQGAACGANCTVARALIGTLFAAQAKPYSEPVPSLKGYHVQGRIDPAGTDARYAATTANILAALTLLFVATLGVYWFTFVKVIRPIKTLTANIETSMADAGRGLLPQDPNVDDEIARVSRSFNALLTRVSAATTQERQHLKMIGHDIRSPLQAVIATLEPSHAAQQHVQRMVRAIQRFDAAGSGADAYGNLSAQVEPVDVAGFLQLVVSNSTEHGIIQNLVYEGERGAVLVPLDADLLEDALDPILVNAQRLRTPDTSIKLRLTADRSQVVIDVENVGPRVPDDMLDEIFSYGVSTGSEDRNLGQGLYAARSFIGKMGGLVRAENLPDGVRIRITFARY